jgi:signal transduction histidine kinase
MTQPIRQGGNLLYRFDEQQEWLSESQIYTQILENAQATLGLRHVALNIYDHPTQTYRTVLSVMRRSVGTQIMKRLADTPPKGKLTSRWPRTLSNPLPITLNPLTELVYRQGQTVKSTLARYGKGAVPSAVLWIATVIGGQGHLVVVPLKTQQLEPGRVMGALAFLQRGPFNNRQVQAAEGFARQAALTLENALLAQALAVRVHDLERSQAQVAQAEERLRREVSEMLHSRVQNRLLVAWHNLGSLELALPEGHYRTLLEQIRRDLDDVRENDVREASHALHPSVIALGLLPAVRSLCRRLSSAVAIDLSADPSLETVLLQEQPKLLMYRTLEEALGNALKHAQAQRIQVNLTHISNTLRLEVIDDGIGFSLENLTSGLGFGLIESRVSVANGFWGIKSDLAQGTQFWAEFPLELAVLAHSSG